MPIRPYLVSVRGFAGSGEVVYGISAAKAKYRFLLSVRDCREDVTFADLQCRAVGAYEPLKLHRTAAYRGVGFVHAGMRVEVDGDEGYIVGSNSSANFDVLFVSGRSAGTTLNCHPNWKMRYFDAAGNVLANFTQQEVRVAYPS